MFQHDAASPAKWPSIWGVVEAGNNAHLVSVLLVFAGVYWLNRNRGWVNNDKFFDLLLARTGSNDSDKAESCQ
jgi:hypothetical protein